MSESEVWAAIAQAHQRAGEHQRQGTGRSEGEG